MMRIQLVILAAAAIYSLPEPVLAQSAIPTPESAASTTSTTTASTTTTTSHAGAYDALSEGNRKIVSAIYEAQLGSSNDSASGALLTRDDIAAMRQGTGWGNVYKQLQQQGYVTGKNLGQAISSYNRSTTASTGTTIVTTAGGDQISVSNKTREATTSSSKAGIRAAAKAEHGKSTVITTAAGGAAGATAAAHASSGDISHAGGNGNGQSAGGGRIK
jgi:hypothetical protein